MVLLRRLWAAYVTPGGPGRPTPQLELRCIYTAWLGAFDSVGYLPPWNWAWVIPVTAGFGLVWAAADTLARSAWLARWQVTDEPRRPRGSRAGPPVAHRRGSPAKTAG